MRNIEEQEVEDLVREARRLGIRNSSDLSAHIYRNRLGTRYPNIAGHVYMANGQDRWTFKGGIDPRFYREVCERLGLDNRRSGAHVTGFDSYRDLAGIH